MVTADSRVVATVQGESLDDAWVAPMAALGSAKPITSHGSLNDPTWSPDGRIVYSSGVDGNIWVMGSDGSNPKQLTSNAEGDFLFLPRVSPDGHYIVSPSLHSGLVQLWRMDSDGNNPKQLTDSFAGVGSDCSPDGKWVVWGSKFDSEKGVWKVPMEGEGGPPTKHFDIFSSIGTSFRWGADSRSLLYTKNEGGVDNIWSQPIAGGKPKQMTHFKSELISSFDLSRDGKRLVMSRGTIKHHVLLIRDLR